MKRLKHRHIFKGKSTYVFISMCIVSFLIISFSAFADKYNIIIDIAALILTFIINFFVINHLTKEEKEKIKNARPPEWKKITKKIKKHFKEDIKALVKHALMLILGEFILSVIVLIIKDFETMLVTLAVLIPATIIVFIVIGIYEHFWANMDNSAVYTRIKVDHWFYGERTRNGRRTYIVFYLPDGKYVLETVDIIMPEEIIVIKYKCFIRWENSIYFI